MLPFNVTPIAASRLNKIIQADIAAGAPPTLRFRISVNAGGCAGFRYDFTFDTFTTPDDLCFEVEGAPLVVDDLSAQFLQGATLDFEQELMGEAFLIRGNPNAQGSCGCGASFNPGL